MNIELSVSELNVIRHALTRLQAYNSKLLDPVMRKHYYEKTYTPEQFDRAELEWDILIDLLNKIPTRAEIEAMKVESKECVHCVKEIDNAGLEAFRCSNSDAIKKNETSWCRPMNANEDCSSCEFYKKR